MPHFFQGGGAGGEHPSGRPIVVEEVKLRSSVYIRPDGSVVITERFWTAYERWRRLQKMRSNPRFRQFGFGK